MQWKQWYHLITIFSIIIVLFLDYYRSSAICTECLTVPASIIVAVLIILLTLYGLIRKGISVSQLTQVRMHAMYTVGNYSWLSRHALVLVINGLYNNCIG